MDVISNEVYSCVKLVSHPRDTEGTERSYFCLAGKSPSNKKTRVLRACGESGFERDERETNNPMQLTQIPKHSANVGEK